MTNKTLKSELQKLARDVVQRLHSGEIWTYPVFVDS